MTRLLKLRSLVHQAEVMKKLILTSLVAQANLSRRQTLTFSKSSLQPVGAISKAVITSEKVQEYKSLPLNHLVIHFHFLGLHQSTPKEIETINDNRTITGRGTKNLERNLNLILRNELIIRMLLTTEDPKCLNKNLSLVISITIAIITTKLKKIKKLLTTNQY